MGNPGKSQLLYSGQLSQDKHPGTGEVSLVVMVSMRAKRVYFGHGFLAERLRFMNLKIICC